MPTPHQWALNFAMKVDDTLTFFCEHTPGLSRYAYVLILSLVSLISCHHTLGQGAPHGQRMATHH